MRFESKLTVEEIELRLQERTKHISEAKEGEMFHKWFSHNCFYLFPKTGRILRIRPNNTSIFLPCRVLFVGLKSNGKHSTIYGFFCWRIIYIALILGSYVLGPLWFFVNYYTAEPDTVLLSHLTEGLLFYNVIISVILLIFWLGDCGDDKLKLYRKETIRFIKDNLIE